MREDATEHGEWTEMIPWYLNGTLEDGEKSRLDAHLEGCGDCRDQVAYWGRVENAVTEQESMAGNLEGWQLNTDRVQALRSRAEAEIRPDLDRPVPFADRILRWWRARTQVPRWAAGLQAAAIAGLMLLVLQPEAPAPRVFETRSDTTASQASSVAPLLVIFEDDVSEAELRRLLLDHDARLVTGPSKLGVYGIAPQEPEMVFAVLLALRESPLVRLAEPNRQGQP